MDSTQTSTTVDLAEVRALFERLASQGDAKRMCDVALQLIAQLAGDVDQLSRNLAKVLARAAGNRSEKIDPNQLWLDVVKACAMAAQPAPPPPPARPDKPRKPRRPTGRKPLPAHLFRKIVPISVGPEDASCACDKPTVKMGVERSEVLEYAPPQFTVIVYEREVRGCANGVCPPVTAPVADKVIDKGLPGPGLLAHVLVQKYADHLPLNRQIGIFARSGIEMSVSTLCDWVREGAGLLQVIADAIFERVLAANVMQGDDTGLRVLDGSVAGGSKKGHLWAFIGDRKHVAFKYTETWKGDEARKHTQRRTGWLQVDGYAGFDQQFNAPVPVIFEVGGWSHARRKYVEARDGGDVRAAVAISIIAGLFAVEREADDAKLDHAARQALRLAKSAPVLDELGAWAAEMRPHAPPKTPLGQAITYTVNQWKQLRRFLDDGAIELTNNAAERALRAVAVGRANWQFAGSDEGARRAAVIYSIIGTCKLQGIDPWAYMRDAFDALSTGFPASRLPELLPDAWTAHRQAQAAEPTAAAAATG
jgi:transposase